jgi:hypothetical protein
MSQYDSSKPHFRHFMNQRRESASIDFAHEAGKIEMKNLCIQLISLSTQPRHSRIYTHGARPCMSTTLALRPAALAELVEVVACVRGLLRPGAHAGEEPAVAQPREDDSRIGFG